MGNSQPDASKRLRGLCRGFNLERLLVFLAALNRDVTVDFRQRVRRKTGSIGIATWVQYGWFQPGPPIWKIISF